MGYHVRKPNGQVFGPYSSDQLRSLRIAGRLGSDDQVRQQGDSKWYSVSDVRGLDLPPRVGEAKSRAGRPGRTPPPRPSGGSVESPRAIRPEATSEATAGDEGRLDTARLDKEYEEEKYKAKLKRKDWWDTVGTWASLAFLLALTAPIVLESATGMRSKDVSDWLSELFDEGVDYSYFHEICESANSSPEQIQEVLGLGVDVNARKKETGETPLMLVVQRAYPNMEIVRILLEGGADVKDTDDDGWTSLHWAARYSYDLEVISALLKAGSFVAKEDNSDLTPLSLAAGFNPNQGVVSLLLKAGGSVSANEIGQTPLHMAAGYNSNAHVVSVLIEAGADVNAKDDDGATPLHWAAARSKNPAVISVLLDAGADANSDTKDGERPLDFASENEALQGTAALKALEAATNQ